jgi:hypothetical protein
MAEKMVTISKTDLEFLVHKVSNGLETEMAMVEIGERLLRQDRKKFRDLTKKRARLGINTPRTETAACEAELAHVKEMISVHEKCICAGPIIKDAVKRVMAIQKHFLQP